MGASTRSLRTIVEDRDLVAIVVEVDRAFENAESELTAGLAAAWSAIEAPCKVYIEDEELDLRNKKTIKNVWKAVSDHLGVGSGCAEESDRAMPCPGRD